MVKMYTDDEEGSMIEHPSLQGWVPQHGKEGWILEEYDWNEQTGTGSFVYSKTLDGRRYVATYDMCQPAYPHHNGFGGLVVVS